MVLKSIKKYVLIQKSNLNGVKAMEKTEEAIDIEDIGTILKSSRLKSEKSLEDISSELCIRKIYLTAIEEGDYETLPPVPYGIGYVRTYARYLGLNPERAVKLYKVAAQGEEAEATEEIVIEPEINKINKWHIIIGVVVLALVCSIWNLLTAKDTAKVTETAKEVTTPVVEKSISEDKGAVTEENKKDEEETKEDEKTKEKVTEETKEDAKEAMPLIDKTKIVLLFSGETWIEVKDKNKVYTQGVFHKGDKKELAYVKSLFITVGRPENIKVYVKGVEKNVLAKNRKSNIPLDSLD